MRIGINGFGLIGQALVRHLSALQQMELVAINESRSSCEEAQHRFLSSVAKSDRAACEAIVTRAAWFCESAPEDLPWLDLGVDVVVEAAEFFKRSELEAHTHGGQVRVLMTGDLREGFPDLTVVPGINHPDLQRHHDVLCAGSDRTQALCPVLDSLHRACWVRRFAACVERPPYVARPWAISHRENDIPQLGRVLPWVYGCGWTCRVEDPHVTLARIRLDVQLEHAVSVASVTEILQDAAQSRFPASMLVADVLPATTGSRYSCLVDATRLRTAEKRAWIEIVYDPIESYAARLLDILEFLS